jgi:hypothetical protein
VFNATDTQGNVSAYPLNWPINWPRSKRTERSKFRLRTVHAAVKFLTDEVRRLPATDLIISTNLRVRKDGGIIAEQRQPEDLGVAVYFTFRKSRVALACDRWDYLDDNMWAIAKHIEALRGQERWGVGTLEQAFTGYVALPAPEQWWQVLGVGPNATPDEVRAAYRELARKNHPDAGGDHDRFVRIQQAYERAEKAKGITA